MEKQDIRRYAEALFEGLPGNLLSAEMDIKKEYIGTPMYDMPIIGVGAADDPLFEEYKKPEVIGPWHMSPAEWLPDAQTVVSFFFPMSKAVRESNRSAKWRASDLWAYARIEGQSYINAYMAAIAAWFQQQGFHTCVPSGDPRWQQLAVGKGIEGYPEIQRNSFGSRWSERHAAYVCGLGTFGLSKGMITEKGMCGRFGSILISEPIPADARPYIGIYDNCIRCGACVRRCPIHAIDLKRGKNHMKCALWSVKISGAILKPRYGCGLCQTKVPCETRIPLSSNRR
ncbi:MAG: 4Fe-4S binding protein [Oscillospiraceae bacterium]|nr:4Fe-4S binding protein [Oscillospiraceae bacterium]MBQ9045852.1 4Fe-4S binding protein [Oscillospiraceae bacterium]